MRTVGLKILAVDRTPPHREIHLGKPRIGGERLKMEAEVAVLPKIGSTEPYPYEERDQLQQVRKDDELV